MNHVHPSAPTASHSPGATGGRGSTTAPSGQVRSQTYRGGGIGPEWKTGVKGVWSGGEPDVDLTGTTYRLE